jgi:hypothetical protein
VSRYLAHAQTTVDFCRDAHVAPRVSGHLDEYLKRTGSSVEDEVSGLDLFHLDLG